VSYDDGDHWESLRLDMPAISVRDLQVKDDSTCHCSDLVIGTHGRGFWILDNITTLRQAAEARVATAAYLFKPPTALRVRYATNDPTPWPPEMPAGENPLPGGIIDYRLGSDASGPVTIEILDAAGTVVRSYSSNEPVLDPHPSKDLAAYDKVCQKTPTATYCGLPLYWPAQPIQVSPKAGMHRFAWDLHYDPIPPEDIADNGDDDATGAVPHHTYPTVNAPWAPPGAYTVRLTVNGKSYTQPLSLRLDPRVKTSALALTQVAKLSREMWSGSIAAYKANRAARALSAALASTSGADVASFKAQVDSIAPETPRARTRFRRRGPAGPTPTLTAASNAMMGAAMTLQTADVAPTATQVAAVATARAQGAAAMAKWTALRTTGLATLNTVRKTAGQPPITVPDPK
jgi:hypothetical protein